MLLLVALLSPLYFSFQERRALEKHLSDPDNKKFAEMIVADTNALSANPDRSTRISATMDMGLEWYNLKQYDFAIRWWKKGLALEENNDIGWYNLGNAYRELKRYTQAEAAYEKSMKVATTGEIDACLALGEMYKYDYVEYRDAEDDLYLECLKKHPKNRDLIARIAIYYRDIGDKKNATRYFDELFSIEPSYDVSEELRKLRMGN